MDWCRAGYEKIKIKMIIRKLLGTWKVKKLLKNIIIKKNEVNIKNKVFIVYKACLLSVYRYKIFLIAYSQTYSFYSSLVTYSDSIRSSKFRSIALYLSHVATTVHRNYWDKCEKRSCSASHKQCKTLFRDHMVRLKIISLYIYKDLRLKT